MNQVLFSSTSDHWETPKELFYELDSEFLFNFDPCPLLAEESGLLVQWSGRVFCNPPYSKIADFLRKGLFFLAAEKVKILVYLLPARTDTKWFHDYCMKAKEIRFLRGRLKFGNALHNAPFPSMVVIFDRWDLD